MKELSKKQLKDILILEIKEGTVRENVSQRLSPEQRVIVSAVISVAYKMVEEELVGGRICLTYLNSVTARLERFIKAKMREIDAARIINFCEGAALGDKYEESEWIASKLDMLLDHVPHLIVHKTDEHGNKLHKCGIKSLFDEIDAIIDHKIVSNQVVAISNDISMQKALMDDENDDTDTFGKLNLVFMGNREDEKNEVARFMAKIYKELGVLEGGEFVTAMRSDIIGENDDETEKNTIEFFKKAEGSVLYLPEFDDMAELQEIKTRDSKFINTLFKLMAGDDSTAVIACASAANIKNLFNDEEEFRFCFRGAVDFSDDF